MPVPKEWWTSCLDEENNIERYAQVLSEISDEIITLESWGDYSLLVALPFAELDFNVRFKYSTDQYLYEAKEVLKNQSQVKELGLKVNQLLQNTVVEQDYMQFAQAFFIKLGKEGVWEKSSIEESKIRIGWKGQNVKDINHKKWDKIRKEINSEMATKGAATKDFNALRNICESNQNDIWITFYASKLWWTRVGEETIYEDNISKYRKTSVPWSPCNISGTELLINSLPGSLTKTQGFRGTVCKVDDQETLKRIINNKPSEIYNFIASTLAILQSHMEEAIKQLHWKDFETFVDLIFRGSGWRRTSMLGENMKFADIELEDPITHDKYQVQIKSTSTLPEFNNYVQQFSNDEYRKLFYVVHSPDKNLSTHDEFPDYIELVKANELARLAVNLGLTDWILQKIK